MKTETPAALVVVEMPLQASTSAEPLGLRDKFGIDEVRLDLGELGHSRRKPTTLGTKLRALRELNGLKALGDDPPDETKELDVEEKVKISSRSWAVWPEGLKTLIVNAMMEELDSPKLSKSAIFKMSAEQWKQHVANDHQPFVRECVACLDRRSRPVKASSLSASARRNDLEHRCLRSLPGEVLHGWSLHNTGAQGGSEGERVGSIVEGCPGG